MQLTHLVVLDFEATCDKKAQPRPQEIIEFPSVLFDLRTLETVSEFESFVRPVHHPTLTDFCRELTSIEQTQVDGAPVFTDVLEAHLAWLASQGLPTTAPIDAMPYAIVTCGDWDLQTMLPAQLRASGLDHVPHPYRQWINIKRIFGKLFKRGGGMVNMLGKLGLELTGRHHRGIDDCRNITKIVRSLLVRHQTMAITARLPASRYPSVKLTLLRSGAQIEVTLDTRSLGTLLGLASGAFRAQATRAFTADGAELLSDDDLLDLRSGDTVRVE